MNTTPLRLVAIEEIPPAADEQGGAPVSLMGEQDMITRKVPEADMIASMDSSPNRPKSSPKLKILVAAGAVAVVVTVTVIALAMRGKSTATPAPVGATSAPIASPEESPQPPPSAAAAAPTAAAAARIKGAPEIIRLVVTAEPMETELSLDGNVLAGHRLNLEVPKDRGIHVVSASAPGHIPFNQQVSFSSDVILKISLHRAHTPPVRQATKSRPAQIEASPKSNIKPTAVSPRPGLEPGMNMDGPSIRHNAKPIDERNPYKP
jgi:hypothetical protein